MLWLEMARDPIHGGGDWGFGKSLWSPSHKRNYDGSLGLQWPYWETVLQVQAGDSILHLRGKGQDAAFVGFSLAASGGFATSQQPPEPGPWGYDNTYYRVLLQDFRELSPAIPLHDVFFWAGDAMRSYIQRNASLPRRRRRRLFCVVQGGRLQCQNGGYLTELDNELTSYILGDDYLVDEKQLGHVPFQTPAGERVQELLVRVGQKVFSDSVKANYGHQCCFPGCDINDPRFLVGSHIARWADVPELRGDLGNGLCLCVFHDKAFELGYFTVDHAGNIVTGDHDRAISGSDIFKAQILPYAGRPIRFGVEMPSVDALRHHWRRLRFPLSM